MSVLGGSSLFSYLANPERLQHDVFCGDFTVNHELVAWKPPSWKLHIFLSSTYSDVILEHRCIMGRILPPLLVQARRAEIDMTVIDADIDIDEDDNEARYFWRIIESEIDRCKSSSNGLFFLSLLGLKYGWCPLVHTIDASVFNEWGDENVDSDVYDVLTKWYTRNDDFDPPRYMLKRFEPGDTTSIFKLLQVLRDRMPPLPFSRSTPALLAGHSLLEWQTLHALCSSNDISIDEEEPGLRSYWIHRSFDGGVHKVDDEDEVYSDAYDNTTRLKLSNLQGTLRQTLGSLSRVKEYNSLQWRSYVSHMDGECDKYMNKWEVDTRKLLLSQLQTILTQKEQWEAHGHGKGVKGSIIEEILHHSHIARTRSESFTGRQELLNRCCTFIHADSRGPSSGNGLDGVFLCISGKPGRAFFVFVSILF